MDGWFFGHKDHSKTFGLFQMFIFMYIRFILFIFVCLNLLKPMYLFMHPICIYHVCNTLVAVASTLRFLLLMMIYTEVASVRACCLNFKYFTWNHCRTAFCTKNDAVLFVWNNETGCFSSAALKIECMQCCSQCKPIKFQSKLFSFGAHNQPFSEHCECTSKLVNFSNHPLTRISI